MSDLRARAHQMITNEPDLCMEIAKLIDERTSANMGLTSRQRELMDFIRMRQRSVGIAPTQEEMANHMRLSSRGAVNRLVDALEERGAIRRMPGKARAIQVVGG